MLAAKTGGDRHAMGFGECGDGAAGGIGPARAAEDHQGTLSLSELALQRFKAIRRWYGSDGDGCLHIRAHASLFQHVAGQRQHYRSRASRSRDLKSARHEFGYALRIVDLGHPFRQRREHLPVFHFLKRFAAAKRAVDLPDEENHRRRILHRGMHADARMRGARPARDEADAGAAGQLAVGFGHVGGRAFMSGDYDADVGIDQRVEHFQIAFAWHAEYGVHAVNAQRFDQYPAAAARLAGVCTLSGGCIHECPLIKIFLAVAKRQPDASSYMPPRIGFVAIAMERTIMRFFWSAHDKCRSLSDRLPARAPGLAA